MKSSDSLRARALHAIPVTHWVPPQAEPHQRHGREPPRLGDLAARAWGVPIAVFIKEKPDGSVDILQDPEVEVRIVEAFEEEGADAWYKPARASAFLGRSSPRTAGRRLTTFSTSGSIRLDARLRAGRRRPFPLACRLKRKRDGGKDTVLYLEGSDQHRGCSSPRSREFAARAAARPSISSSPTASRRPTTAAKCRSRSATPSRHRT